MVAAEDVGGPQAAVLRAAIVPVDEGEVVVHEVMRHLGEQVRGHLKALGGRG